VFAVVVAVVVVEVGGGVGSAEVTVRRPRGSLIALRRTQVYISSGRSRSRRTDQRTWSAYATRSNQHAGANRAYGEGDGWW